MKNNPRAIAAAELARVIGKGQAFDGSLPADLLPDRRDQSLAREICYGSLRHYPLLKAQIDPLLKKPLSKKDADIYALLISAIYQLRFMQKPDHAVINAAVDATRALKKPWAKGLVNAVLRNWQRSPRADDSLKAAARLSHPEWLYQKISNDWPDKAEQIFSYNNSPPPMTLRLAPGESMDDYLVELAQLELQGHKHENQPMTLTLEKATSVDQLPGFSEGRVSIQDAGAQWAGRLLELQSAFHVLDACAAPGGKSIHALQLQPDISLIALDQQAHRLQLLDNDFLRCGVKAEVSTHCTDANKVDEWTDGRLFDRILLDAPCSGSGIISHHPDIKLLRRPEDLLQFGKQQLQLLESLWPLLKEGGKLLYCTCSIMPEENDQVIQSFLSNHHNAMLDQLDLKDAIDKRYGYQLLPNAQQNGGFFYARISKHTKL